MTGEKKALVLALVMSVVWLLICVFMLIWSIQTGDPAKAWFWGIFGLAPVAVAYETLRRWNRG